jgi:hypothetical protein
MKTMRIKRRDFLGAAAAAAAAIPTLIPSRALGGGGQRGANDRANIGVIGLGGRARWIVEKEYPAVAQMRIVAVCDCFRPRCDDFVRALGKDQKWNVYEDFRRMIAQEKLDGVMVETTTHARAWIAVQVMQAGLDVYIEKPMCLTIAEGREMVRAARKLRRVTQIGTQQRSMPINNWASDLVKNGALGKVLQVVAPNFVGPEKWSDKPARPMPQGGSEGWWDAWTNQAVLRPYHPELHYAWPRWWDYDGGGLGFGVTGWGTHSYGQINRALGTDETGPVEVLLEEPLAVRDTGKYVRKQSVGGPLLGETGDIDTGTEYHDMAKLRGPRAKVSMKFAHGIELKLRLDGDRGPGLGAIFVGEKGKIEINRNKLASNPKELVRSPDNPGPNQRPESAYHLDNWIDCIKSRQRCNADIEFGQRSSTLCYLVNIAHAVGRVGEALKWDPAAERFTNCDEANKLLSRPKRKGYELPNIS